MESFESHLARRETVLTWETTAKRSILPCLSPSTQTKMRCKQPVNVEIICSKLLCPCTHPPLLFSALHVPYPFLFAPHPPCFCLSSRCRWMALGEARLTPCNKTITHQFDNKFMYSAQHNNIPDDDAMEVDESHASQKNVGGFVARACVWYCMISTYFQGRKIIFQNFGGETEEAERTHKR